MRLISDLGQFVRAAVAGGKPGVETEALQAVMHAQQQLFQQPPEVILQSSLDEQIDHLARGETPEGAAARVDAYATILSQAAQVYDHLGRDSLAQSSRILALSALLTATVRWPEQRDALADTIARLHDQIPIEEFPPPLVELWSHYETAQVP